MKSPYQGSYDLIKNKYSLRIDGSDVVTVLSEGRSQRILAKTNDFFDLDLMNSKSNSYKMMIHFEYLSPRNSRDKMYVIGLQSEMTMVFPSRI